MLNVRTIGTLAAAAVLATATLVAQTTKPKPAAGDAAKPATEKPAGEKAAAKPAAVAPKHVIMTAEDMKWGPGPDALPAGAQMAILDGDPGKAGMPFVLRAKLPDGYKIMPHWHPTDETVTVISGAFQVGMGDTWSDSSLKELKAGDYGRMGKTMRHFAQAKGDTVIQVGGMGPFAITYVNPKDDPRKKATH